MGAHRLGYRYCFSPKPEIRQYLYPRPDVHSGSNMYFFESFRFYRHSHGKAVIETERLVRKKSLSLYGEKQDILRGCFTEKLSSHYYGHENGKC